MEQRDNTMVMECRCAVLHATEMVHDKDDFCMIEECGVYFPSFCPVIAWHARSHGRSLSSHYST